MALFWRIWAAFLLVNAAVLGIFVALATLQFGNIGAELVGQRLTVLASRTATPFAAAARIGLPLSTVRNARALLERARQTDNAITAIHIFDEAGRIVHSTAGSVAGAIPTAAIDALKRAPTAVWHREGNDRFVSGVAVTDAAGSFAGGVLIDYPIHDNADRVWAMGAGLALAALLVSAGAGLLGTAVLRWGLRRQIAAFDAFERTLSDFEHSSWRSAAGNTLAGESGDAGLRRLLTEAEIRYRQTGRQLTAARRSAQ